MFNVVQFRTEIIEPTLKHLGMYSEAASNLLVGTAIQESGLSALRQMEDGPALGVYQIEPNTHADVWGNYLKYRSDLSAKITHLSASLPVLEQQLVTNLSYATAIARIVYYRRPESLPGDKDIDGLAQYWKSHFNTHKGAGIASEWASKYRKYGNG